jgi:hypothetical protein
MADAFEDEIEQLVARVTGELAREITTLILRRLGIAGGQPSAVIASRPKRRGPAPKTTAPVKRAASKRSRASAGEMAERADKVARVIEQGDGVSVSDIEKKTKLDRVAVQAAIRVLRDQGRIFMGGQKRFARYAGSQKAADAASEAAKQA